ncbi:hypothetical protein AQUCO_00100206v1 [Aquilegia coerulea]|uniref:Thioredoxin domain-containing protein n=1 Tax=Aquilegia coerulea TaxID=218851 RepID=A0A2G5F9E5_AQUCA|nr:hypothetical protein AQUCO_00100206v1 [Aquilegia coerulea]
MLSIIANPKTSIPFSMFSIPSTSSSTHLLQNSHQTFLTSSNNNSIFQLRNQRTKHCTTPRLSIRCGVTQISQSEFSDTVLKSDVPVLVEFIADWCGPCRLIAPAIEWASQEYKDKLKVVKIDHDSNPQLIEEYKVYGLPALILFNKGKEIRQSRREGAITKVKLKEYLDSLLESIAIA